MSDFISAVDRTQTSHGLSCSVHKLRQYEITSAWWGFCLFFFPLSTILSIEGGLRREVKGLSCGNTAGVSP